MLLVVPVSRHDGVLSEDFCDIVSFFAPYRHRLLVVSRPSDSEFAANVFQRLGCFFERAELHLFPEDGPQGWPLGPNFYWQSSIEYLRDSQNVLPWFWMEMDTTPIEERWLDALEDEYMECGKECLGVLQPNIGQNTKHLLGVAVYPPRVDQICTRWELAAKMSLAFDVLCQKELVPVAANSRLLQNNFRTQYYRCTNEGLRGIDMQFRPNGVTYDDPVKPGVVLVHGCNDGSLARLILQKG